MPDIVQGNSWDLLMWNGHQRAHQFANRNWQVVVSSPDVLYFDFPYEADPQEHGYYWASRHINTEKVFQFMPDNLPAHAEFWLDREDRPYTADDTIIKNDAGEVEFAPLAKGKQFIGIQGQLWSENTRTNNMAEYKLFPRLLSLAQRAWHKAQWAVPYDHNGFVYSRNTQRFTPSLKQQRDQQWLTFAASLGLKEFNKLERANVHFRIANAGAKIENGMLYANVAYPGLLIEYMQAGGQWQTYNAPVKVTQDVWVRSKLPISGRVSRTLKVTQP
jgi:hexosaminidase